MTRKREPGALPKGVYEVKGKCPRCGGGKTEPSGTPCKKCRGEGKVVVSYGAEYSDQYHQRHRVVAGSTISSAVTLYNAHKADVSRDKWDPDHIKRKRVLVKDAIAAWVTEAKATKRSWQDDVRFGEAWKTALGTKVMEDVRPEDVQRWRRARLATGSKPATVNRYVAFLKRVFNVAIRDQKCKENPVRSVGMLRENNARVRWLTADEEKALREHFPPRLWHLVELAMKTGLRQGEQMALRWDHVDFGNAVITIPLSKHGEKRHVPMHPKVAEILQGLPSRGESPWVYPGRQDKHMNWKTSVRHHWEDAIEAAGILDFHWHDLRHTFCSRLVMAGVDLYRVKELAGHKTISVTERYAHLAPSALSEAINRL